MHRRLRETGFFSNNTINQRNRHFSDGIEVQVLIRRRKSIIQHKTDCIRNANVSRETVRKILQESLYRMYREQELLVD